MADAVESGRVTLVASPAAINEFTDVTSRPSMRRLFDAGATWNCVLRMMC